MIRLGALCLLVVASAACAAKRPQTRLVGPARDVVAIAGHWTGEYGSPTTGRSGTIEFTVAPQGDSASGVVVMIPAGFGQPLRPWRDPALLGDGRSSAIPTLLTITLVWVKGDRVNGSLAPYADPETGTRLFTTFSGRLVADTISGTFSTGQGTAAATEETGRWRVVRARP
jgi:hypothetical protein